MASMRATVLHAPRDIRLDDVPDPDLRLGTDAIVRVVASCICGSDLWPYRGINEVTSAVRIGHEFVGVVERVGDEVATIRPGDFVIAPFTYSDNSCRLCERGVHTSCVNGGFWGGTDKQGHTVDGGQGELVRVPWADGTLVATPSQPSQDMVTQLLTLADVFPTGHHAAVSAGVTPGSTVAVVGDGAVGLSAVLAAKRLGAGRVVAMSRHEDRQRLARTFGADEVVAERGKDGAAAVREILDGIGADFVLECVGTADSMKQAMLSARPGGRLGYVGVPHEVQLNVPAMFARNIGIAGGVAPVRAYLDELLPDVLDGTVTPGDVFDLALPLDRVADGYRAMDERTAVKTMLTL
jgi:threonine dehydrogenase-like Zn-dependent dehydrogenase